MKRFNVDFKTKLYKSISEIENNSMVEIVTIIKSKSGRYRETSLWCAVIFMIFIYTFFMFAPIEFNVYLIYIFTILGFFAGFAACELIHPLQKLAIPKKQINKNVELFARAIFQKGGIRHTKEKIGVLFFISLFEEKTMIIPDRGAETAIPAEEWEKINLGFQNIFKSQNIPDAIISELNNCLPIFSKYIPPVENDINELPDNLDVDI